MSSMSPDEPGHSLYTLRVGAPYNLGRRSYPEAVQYHYRAGGHELLMWLGRLTPRDVQAITRGPADFALAAHPPVLFLLYRFGAAIPWSDTAFTVWMVPEDERTLPELAHLVGLRALLSVVLVDAATGLVCGLRTVTLSPAFTMALHLAIRDQHVADWPGQDAYDRALEALYRRYPSTDMLLATATIRTEGRS
jgi:hypothetical protein